MIVIVVCFSFNHQIVWQEVCAPALIADLKPIQLPAKMLYFSICSIFQCSLDCNMLDAILPF